MLQPSLPPSLLPSPTPPPAADERRSPRLAHGTIAPPLGEPTASARPWSRRLRLTALPPAKVRQLVVVMVAATALVMGVAIARVARRHEVVRLGYALTQASAELREARETGRRLELERATLTAPARIRALAERLGMRAVPPDQIRVVPATGGGQ